jgi:hypothetical protein
VLFIEPSSPFYVEMHSKTEVVYQVISNTGFESPSATKGESCRVSHLRSNEPQLHGRNPIGPSTLLRMVSLSNHFVPAS